MVVMGCNNSQMVFIVEVSIKKRAVNTLRGVKITAAQYNTANSSPSQAATSKSPTTFTLHITSHSFTHYVRVYGRDTVTVHSTECGNDNTSHSNWLERVKLVRLTADIAVQSLCRIAMASRRLSTR